MQSRFPIFQTGIQELSLLQTRWASILNPLVSIPLNSGTLLEGVSLSSGSNVVNHTLGRPLRGWMISRMRAGFAEIYDTQDQNSLANLTLLLHASAPVVVDLFVF